MCINQISCRPTNCRIDRFLSLLERNRAGLLSIDDHDPFQPLGVALSFCTLRRYRYTKSWVFLVLGRRCPADPEKNCLQPRQMQTLHWCCTPQTCKTDVKHKQTVLEELPVMCYVTASNAAVRPKQVVGIWGLQKYWICMKKYRYCCGEDSLAINLHGQSLSCPFIGQTLVKDYTLGSKKPVGSFGSLSLAGSSNVVDVLSLFSLQSLFEVRHKKTC